MPAITQPGQGVIFMKVGLHAQETIEDIIVRKQKEFDEAGVIFWGYGGNSCYPNTMVQPFVKEMEKNGNQVLLIMHKMNSKHEAPPELAKEYSEDGVTWQPVPNGVEVRGSRFAMVLDELKIEEYDINLKDYEVGVGRSRGKNASQYITGQSDKGCFLYQPPAIPIPPEERIIKNIGLVARIKAPYAVFLK
ncbi:MAG: hypothetical protein Q7T42_10810 [Methylotenera sp.]|uniref:hypothetical protein n=1 Tax=Methylotenera sp. TaxID=2051956 RepID=UPI00271D57AC|nr:hypothetical protein [Methylotenera sp.]MDO9394449.1 hypothetical protein [Methylotenera sp.]